MTSQTQSAPPVVQVRRHDRTAPVLVGHVPLTLVLDNLRSAFNVGNILRLAEAVRAEGVLGCGCTATPPHRKLAVTARGCETHVACRHLPSAAAAIELLRAEGRRVYGIETAAGAQPVWQTQFQFPAVLVLGNEALGITPAALARCDELVALPCFGQKNSINVGNCAAVVVYEALRQYCQQAGIMTVAATAAGAEP